MRSFKPASKSHELGLFGRVMLYGAPFVFFIFLVVTANKRGGFMRHSNSHLHSKYGGQHQFLFMAMLHQPSSPLYNYICKHDDISCVGEPGLGQKVQSLYESDTLFGGPNRFGLENRAKLDEFDIRNTASNRRKLFSEWARYWDVSRSVLMEYSGSDILRLKFLNAMFPQGERFFVVAVRHPAAAFFDRWPRGSGVESKLSINQVVEHWLECFESLRSDLLSLDNVIVVDLDLLKQHPQRLLNFLFTWLEVNEPEKFKPILSSDKKWREDLEDLPLVERQALINAFEHRVAAFGYSMKNLTLSPSLQATTTKVGVPVPSLETISTLQHDDVVELLISSQQRAHDVVDAKDLQHLAAAPVGDDVAVNETPEDVLNWRGLTLFFAD